MLIPDAKRSAKGDIEAIKSIGSGDNTGFRCKRGYNVVAKDKCIEEIEKYLEKYPEEVVRLFMQIRDIIFSLEDIPVEEKLWAKLPSYYYGEKFVRIIPFKDHINIEADGFANHVSEFEGFKFTPKGMLQIQINRTISIDLLKTVFCESYLQN